MNDADYDRCKIVTTERIVASILVTSWVACAFVIGGISLAVRAGLLFMLPLAFIWLPDLFAKIATLDVDLESQISPKTSPFMIRLVAWLIIIGVPASWFVFRTALEP